MKNKSDKSFYATMIIILAMFMLFELCLSLHFGKNTEAKTEIKTDNLYALSTTVTSINPSTDTVTVEDYNGNLWSFSGIEDWQINDRCSLIMNTNNTPSIYDDIIVSQKYDGRNEIHDPDNWAMDYCESNITIADWNDNGKEIAFQLSDGTELYAEKASESETENGE